MGLQTTPKEDSGYAPAEALFGTQLAVPGEFLDAPDLPPTDFLQKIDSAITRFSEPVLLPPNSYPGPIIKLGISSLLEQYFVHPD